jgi:peptidoglycan L-alanyl-D-glutamate endopeptidase CwlK
MKRFKKDILAWIVICLFFIAIFIIYNRLDPDLTKDESFAEIPYITELHPDVAEKTEELIRLAADKHIEIVITDTVRTMEEQEALYAQGRDSEGNIITYARPGESFHNYGLAVDFALKNEAGDIIWDTSYDGNDNGKSDWVEVADIAKELGFEWGGDWAGFQDYPHLQMTFGRSLRELQNGDIPE